MKKLLLPLVLLLLISFGCQPTHKTKLHCYVTEELDNDMIYWYIIYGGDGQVYSYNSPTPVTNFSNVNWSQSKELPNELEQ